MKTYYNMRKRKACFKYFLLLHTDVQLEEVEKLEHPAPDFQKW